MYELIRLNLASVEVEVYDEAELEWKWIVEVD